MLHTLIMLILLSLLQLAGATPQPDDSLTAPRERFIEAHKALKEKDIQRYRDLADTLHDYPLYPYLEFEELRSRLNRSRPGPVMAFIERNKGTPLGKRLRRLWLYTLARRKDWPRFLEVYTGDQPVALQCYRLQAMLDSGPASAVTEPALALWLVGHSQDKACDPVFAWLEKTGKFTPELRRQRIRLAMEEGNPGLAGYLARDLPENEQARVALWREARQSPAQTLDSHKLDKDNADNREIIIYAIRRIARSDAAQAYRRWQKLRRRHDFEKRLAAEVERDIALYASWQRLPEAHDWLAAVDDSVANEKLHEWRARTAASRQLWDALLEHIEAMPPDQADRDEWRYWKAMALQYSGQRQDSRDRLAILAKTRDYHGFLAADSLRWPYEMNNRPFRFEQAELDAVAQLPALVRARELHLADMNTDARREWYAAISRMNDHELQLASELARQWGWHDHAILTVARSGEYDNLTLRFPVEYRSEVTKNAERFELDPAHIYAVIRQESAFNKDAHSPAGARGLMQLMPFTGRTTANKLGIRLGNTRHLYDSDSNIMIGSAYLKEVMQQYDDNIVLASAAYNAGPRRVERWLPEEQSTPAENWIVLVPFDETRKYIQRVLAYAAIYDWRLQRPMRRLDELMQDVYPVKHYEQLNEGPES